MGFYSSDEAGLIEEPGFCEGRFSVLVEQARYWRTLTLVHGAATDEVTDVQVRRLADVSFDVRSTSGLTVRDRPIRIESLEFETDVSAWVASGKVSAPDGLVTDSAGHLRVTGLPRGDYRWMILDANGVATEGEVTLAPWVETPVTVLID